MTEHSANSQSPIRTDVPGAPASRRPTRESLRKRRRQMVAICATVPALLATSGLGSDASAHHGRGGGPAHEPRVSFIETHQGPPEDIIALPRTRWVVISSMKSAAHSGGLSLVNSRSEEVTNLWPVENFAYAPDTTAFPGCVTPPDESDAATHGVNVMQTGRWTFDLYVVYHGSRESIEVFSLNVRGNRPTASWRGCVETSPGIAANSVAVLPDGGLAITNPYDISKPTLQEFFSTEPSGQLWTWHRESGWLKVPGSEMHFPNGIEVSDDGATLYAAETTPSVRNITSVPTAGGTQRVVGHTELLPDNLRWTDSGTLLTTGPLYGVPPTIAVVGECFVLKEAAPDYCVRGFDIAEIDPATGTTEVIFSSRTPQITQPTVAAPVGRDIWIGSNGSERIAVVSGLDHPAGRGEHGGHSGHR